MFQSKLTMTTGLIGGRFLENLSKIVSCVKNRNFKIMMENSVSNDVPEQTYNDDSLFRPMSLANVSGIADPSTDKSKMLHQIWNEHRSPRDTGTPLNEEEDLEGDHTSTPVAKELSANKSMATRFYERHFQRVIILKASLSTNFMRSLTKPIKRI